MTEKKEYQVTFLHSEHDSVTLAEGAILSQHLTATNSPLLFGCRSGICGTCLSEVVSVSEGGLPPPSLEEKDLLEVLAPSNPRARLACQLRLTASITIVPLEEEKDEHS